MRPKTNVYYTVETTENTTKNGWTQYGKTYRYKTKKKAWRMFWKYFDIGLALNTGRHFTKKDGSQWFQDVWIQDLHRSDNKKAKRIMKKKRF